MVAGLLVGQSSIRKAFAGYVGAVLAALHDVGKVSPGFQKKCPVWLKNHVITAHEVMGMEEDHAKISQKAIQDLLPNEHRFWAAIIGGHHGRLKGDRVQSLCDGGVEWARERKRLVEKLTAEFGALPSQAVGMRDAQLWFNAGLIAVADWLASDERTFPPSKILDGAEIRERAEAQLEQIGFRSMMCPPGKTFSGLFPFSPNKLQSIFSEAVRYPGVYVVEAAMGCGKTEAALIAAYNLLAAGQATGIYFALPTQVTSNRIHRRVAAFMDQLISGAGVRLIHGNSWLIDKNPPLDGVQDGTATGGQHEGRDWFASSRRALLAPFGVGTVDQALLGVVAAKHFFVRQFGLAGKVVILDEVHSYDLYTGTLLDQLVKQLRELGATVIILSATLIASRRRQLLGIPEDSHEGQDTAYPLLSGNVDGRTMEYPVPPDPPKSIQVHFMDGASLPEAVLERAESGECVLWIRNTVGDAQETYRQLCGRNRVGGPEIALLHARFPQFRREELENDWLERLGKDQSKRPTSGCVLVSTQVAEQSVDIDADLLVTDLAPTDMLLQRVGRLWRHPRPRPVGCSTPEVWIAKPALDSAALGVADVAGIKAAFGKSAKVYAPYVLLRTFFLWSARADVTLPGDIRLLLEATYADPVVAEPRAWSRLREELELRKDELRTRAIASSNPWQVAMDDKEGVQTRWNSSPTIDVILVGKMCQWDTKHGARLELFNGAICNLKQGVFDYDCAKALHRNRVKVPRWSVKGKSGATPGWLREYLQDEIVVCKLSGEQLLILPTGEDSGLKYRDDIGVVIQQWQATEKRSKQGIEEDDDESYD